MSDITRTIHESSRTSFMIAAVFHIIAILCPTADPYSTLTAFGFILTGITLTLIAEPASPASTDK